MSALTRRLFLRNTAAVGAVAVTVATPAVAETVKPTTAKERFAFHLAELKRAAEELDPRIGQWHVVRLEDDDLTCPLIISARRHTGRYEGDGTYESGTRSGQANGGPQYKVRLLDHQLDGHRAFHVSTPMDKMVLTEPALNTFIGRRVA